MRIHNPFRTGLLAGLGVLLALAIGAAIGQLATILTYVVAALFLALGLDPLISALQRRRVPRWLAIVIVLVLVLGVLAALLFSIVPVITNQTTELVKSISTFGKGLTWKQFIAEVQKPIGGLVRVQDIVDQGTAFLQKNVAGITSGVLQVGLGIVGGLGGTVIVLILTIYFTANLDTLKRGLYLLVPMTRRQRFAEIAEQIFSSVGRYVIGQVTLALVNGVLSFAFLSIIGAKLPAVFAFIAFLGSLIPLVGTISGAVVIVLGQLLLAPTSVSTWVATGIYYLVYMQVEAYVLSPNIMNRAVKVPGVVVVIAALVGGTLLGILGALIAIPVAAAILLILQQVVVPRQAEL